MREILFRGKSILGKWVEGLPYEVDGVIDCIRVKEQIQDIISYTTYKVIPESISEFTGLTDKNGKKIFEGDIVKHYNNSDDGFDIGALYWDETFSQWKRTSIGNFHNSSFTYMMSHSCEYEVIGNIHDNPELLKGGAE